MQNVFVRVVIPGLIALALAGSLAHAQDTPKKGALNIVCAPVADWCAAIAADFQRDTGIAVNMIRKSTGEILAQVRAEAQNPKIDIWFGGATDSFFTAADAGLLQPYTSPNMVALLPWAKKAHEQSAARCVGISSGSIGIVYNTELLAKKNIAAPKAWQDLLKPEFKGEVQLPNPNSSGTAYTIIAGFVQMWGEDAAFEYMKKLHLSVNAYTRSGTGPIRAVSRGETGVGISFDMDAGSDKAAGFPIELIYPPEGTSYEVACMAIIKGARNDAEAKRFYDWYLTVDAMKIGPRVNQWHLPSLPGISSDPRMADQSKIKLIDYDFVTYGSTETRKRLLDRWEREIGSLPR
jgi:iron(III) transport system substrate-binding protein